MPINSIKFHGNWGNNSPNYGYDTNSINLLKSDRGLNKIHKVWSKTEQTFNLHFIRSKRTESEILAHETPTHHLRSITGFEIEPDSEAITIVYLNNESRGDDANMFTGWIAAHRACHAMGSTLMQHLGMHNDFLQILTKVYGLNGHTEYSYGNCTLALRLANAIGTMKSARTKCFPRFWEFIWEIITQWLITKNIKFNNLPERLGSYHGKDVANNNKWLQALPEKYNKVLEREFKYLKGRIFCM